MDEQAQPPKYRRVILVLEIALVVVILALLLLSWLPALIGAHRSFRGG